MPWRAAIAAAQYIAPPLEDEDRHAYEEQIARLEREVAQAESATAPAAPAQDAAMVDMLVTQRNRQERKVGCVA